MRRNFVHKALGKLVFTRWSGKGFAVFASLHKVVHIGQLKTVMADMALRKGACIDSEILFNLRELMSWFDEEEDWEAEAVLQNLTPIVVSDYSAPKGCDSIFYCLTEKIRVGPCADTDFLFYRKP